MMPGHLPESRGEPDDKQQTDAGPGESGAHAGGRPIDNGDSCGSFGQHHWADGKGCTDLVGLLVAGEAPQKILGGLNFVWRKYFKATQQAVQGTPLKQAIKQAGVFPRDVDSTERYLRRLTRKRAEKNCLWLLETDLNLKGKSRLTHRLELERLLFLLSGCI